MLPKRSRSEGFTLIELLTVIAIIGILSSILIVAVPRALERAKITKMQANMKQIETILTAYYTDHGSYPPAYGYLDFQSVRTLRRELEQQGGDFELLTLSDINTLQTANPPVRFVHTIPWMARIGHHDNLDLYDIFSEGYDTNHDEDISRLEFSPQGAYDSGSQTYNFNTPKYRTVYNPAAPGTLQTPVNVMLNSDDPRPLIYLPVNKRLFNKVKAEWFRDANNSSNPRPDDSTALSRNDTLEAMSFPPPNYDAFVLISVGPANDTFAILQNFADGIMQSNNYPDAYFYHVLGMATYFLATRDAERGGRGNGELDFDYIARSRRGEGQSPDNNLTGSSAPRGYGPLIFVGGG